jgi:hypothetical protein
MKIREKRTKEAKPSQAVGIKTVENKIDKQFERRESMEAMFIESINENFLNDKILK